MSNNMPNENNCENCAFRKNAEAKPCSLLGRLCFWHIKWCPGWKEYQASLEQNELSQDKAG